MRGKWGLAWIGVCALGALVLAAPGGASMGTAARQATQQKFMFKEFDAPGPHEGIVLTGTGEVGCATAPYCDVFEPGLGASGRVVGGGPYPDCAAGYHYHGIFNGEPDPAATGCGWGRMVDYSTLSPTVQSLADSITSEEEAIVAAKAKKGVKLVKSATASLNEVLPGLFSDLTSATLIHEAADLDKKAQHVLDKASGKDVSKKDENKAKDKAEGLIQQALLRKRQVLERIYSD